MDFDGAIYGQTFDNLENAIHAASMRQTRIAQNIANIESDNYSKNASFADALDKAKANQENKGGGVTAVRFNAKEELENAQGRRENKQTMIDNELSNLAENNLKLTSYSQLLSSKLKILRKVVTLGKG